MNILSLETEFCFWNKHSGRTVPERSIGNAVGHRAMGTTAMPVAWVRVRPPVPAFEGVPQLITLVAQWHPSSLPLSPLLPAAAFGTWNSKQAKSALIVPLSVSQSPDRPTDCGGSQGLTFSSAVWIPRPFLAVRHSYFSS